MVLYSDDNIVAVNKKAGAFVQHGKDGGESLLEQLEKNYGKLFIVHRIDAPVSGIVVLARNKEAAADLSRQFSEGSIEKRYICAVDNEPPAESGTLIDFIHIPSGKKVNKVYIRDTDGPNVKKAVLSYRLIFRTERYHILEVRLVTGRKHQIRAQLAAAGCHIKGDVKYGARRTNCGGGIHLHALSLQFRLPGTGVVLQLTAPLPDDPLWNITARCGLKELSGPQAQLQEPE